MEFPDGEVTTYTANIIAENMYAQCDEAGNQTVLMDEIVDHKSDATATAIATTYSTNNDILLRDNNDMAWFRPDGEEKGQPTFGEIQDCAKAQGLQARYVPVKPSGATEANYIAFSKALAELPEPVLGYCRSGQRAATLWHARRGTAA